jgi:hypothetical protein
MNERQKAIVARFERQPRHIQGMVLMEAAQQMNNSTAEELLVTHWTSFIENGLDMYGSDY